MEFTLDAASPAERIREVYDRVGFVSFPNLLGPDEVALLDAAYWEGVESGAIARSEDAIGNNNDAIFRHPLFERYVKDDRILAIASAVIGRGFEVQHTKLNAKPPGGRGGAVPWHQDFPYFPHTNYDLPAVLIHLDDEDETNGALRFIPGSHAWGVLPHHDTDGNFLYQAEEQAGCDAHPSVLLKVPAGTVSVHHSLALHKSDDTTSGCERRLLVFQYRAEDAVQLAGAIWRCSGYPVRPQDPIKRARFPDGSSVVLRGRGGRLFDLFGTLQPDSPASGGYKTVRS